MNERTGWPPGLLQDDCRKLARWFSSRPDARRIVRQVAAEHAEAADLTRSPTQSTAPNPLSPNK